MNPGPRFPSLLTRQRTSNFFGDFARRLHGRIFLLFFLLFLRQFRLIFRLRFVHLFGNLVPNMLELRHDDRSSQAADCSDDQTC